jgi:hypothetical protein
VAGLLRNLFTLVRAIVSGTVLDARACVTCHFLATPFDCGTRVLKSDRYLQFAESAQLDFLVKTRLIGALLRSSVRFVNASQLVKFAKPIPVWHRIRVQTSIVYADEKCAYFSHVMFLREVRHAEVLVKMKFKKGGLTIAPAEIMGRLPDVKHEYIEAWNQMLEAMR